MTVVNESKCGKRRVAENALGALFDLDMLIMRHNIYYITGGERPDGQTAKARPEDAGTEAYWHPQPPSRRCCRRAFQRESVLRSSGPSPGPLRDDPPSQR